MPSNFKALAAASGGEPTDANFKNVTLLLHGDGSNGAQNNTFIDSSTNNFTITRNGNTTQGSFSPYGSNWSNYFDGSGDYLQIANNAALGVPTGDFTFETWVFPTTLNGQSVTPIAIYAITNVSTTSDLAYACFINSTNKIDFTVYVGSTKYSAVSSASISANTWTHIAAVRSGNTLTLYVNGTSAATVTISGTINDSTNPVYRIGGYQETSTFYYFTGYISNQRFVKGTALYTANFTPPTTPLTAITNTSLLTCAYNRFRDGSTNNFTITRNGDVKVTNFAPFAPSSAYSTTTNGGSGYFDGSGDYLTVAYNTALNVPGDFTVEAWVYQTSRSGDQSIINRSGIDFAQFSSFELIIASDGTVTFIQGSGTGTSGSQTVLNSTITVPLNSWVHIAGVRNGSTNKLYINGVEAASGTSGSNDGNTSSSVFIGARGASSILFNGFISSARLVKGTAVYTAAFTPPTTPLTAISGTSLLANFTNAAIFDNSMKNDLETVGNAQISTSVKKFGTGSMYFDGNADWLIAPYGPYLDFGTGDFTVEMWVYFPSSVSTNNTFVAGWTSGEPVSGWVIGADSSYFYFASAVSATYATNAVNTAARTTGTWHHIAAVRSSGNVTLYVNGAGGTTVSNTQNITTAATGLNIGRSPYTGYPNYLTGYIDDLRITKGVARYTANFTPPTAPFPNK